MGQPLVTPGREGESVSCASVRLRCDFLKFIKKQMPHFTLFRTIGICFFINFENQHPRPNTANFRIYPYGAGLYTNRRKTREESGQKGVLFFCIDKVAKCY